MASNLRERVRVVHEWHSLRVWLHHNIPVNCAKRLRMTKKLEKLVRNGHERCFEMHLKKCLLKGGRNEVS
jgi:hypothetical protein